MEVNMEQAYERMYVEFIDYIARNFEVGMSDATVYAEALTNIAKEEIEIEMEEVE